MKTTSSFAPVVLLGGAAVVLVLVLGFAFAVKPQIDGAADVRSDKEAVEANIAKVQDESRKIDEFAALVADDSGLAAAIALNAPSSPDIVAFRTRVWMALLSSQAELVSFAQSPSVPVDGWATDSRFLVSAQVASLFQTGPVAVSGSDASAADETASAEDGATPDATAPASGDGWTPVVAAPTGVGPVASDIAMIPFSMVIAGTPTEAHAFLSALSAPDQQLFQVYGVVQTARQPDSSPVTGVSDAGEGNVLTTITGSLYFLGADGLTDETGDGGVPSLVPNDGGFVEIGPSGPQPGA